MSHRPEVVYGFHGCDESVARRILEGGNQLSPSYNAYDWLGNGIYFWEDAPERAMQWAVEMKKPLAVVLDDRSEAGAPVFAPADGIGPSDEGEVVQSEKEELLCGDCGDGL